MANCMTNYRLEKGDHYAGTNSEKWPYRVKRRLCFWHPVLEGIKVKHYLFAIKNGCITVEPGYHWNGCNGVKDTEENLRFSLFHDVGYQCLQQKSIKRSFKNRLAFDRLAKIITKEDGMAPLESQVYFYVLRLFGGLYAYRK